MVFLFGSPNSNWYLLLIPVVLFIAAFKAGEWHGGRKQRTIDNEYWLRRNDIDEQLN